MNKIKSLSQILVSAYLIRLLVTGASLGDALVMIGLCGLYGLFMHLEALANALEAKKHPEANGELKEKVAELEKALSLTSNKVAAMQIRR